MATSSGGSWAGTVRALIWSSSRAAKRTVLCTRAGCCARPEPCSWWRSFVRDDSGYADAGPVTGSFTTEAPFAARIDLDALH